MISDIPSAKCTRGPEYTRGVSRHLRYFSTLTHSLPILELAIELRYKWSSSLLVTLCLSCVVVCGVEGYTSIYTRSRGSAVAILGMSLASTTLACPHATAYRRGG